MLAAVQTDTDHYAEENDEHNDFDEKIHFCSPFLFIRERDAPFDEFERKMSSAEIDRGRRCAFTLTMYSAKVKGFLYFSTAT